MQSNYQGAFDLSQHSDLILVTAGSQYYLVELIFFCLIDVLSMMHITKRNKKHNERINKMTG